MSSGFRVQFGLVFWLGLGMSVKEGLCGRYVYK
jgi:hypothetical protein